MMTQPKICIRKNIHKDSVLHKQFNSFDFIDAYEVEIPWINVTVTDVAHSFFTSSPKWINTLMKTRNSLVRLFGLKTGGEPEIGHISTLQFNPGDKFGLFEIKDRNVHEIIMGADDKHLDFRVSLFVDHISADKKSISIGTVSMIHNFLGRMYMKTVTPFHQKIVRSMLISIYKDLHSKAKNN